MARDRSQSEPTTLGSYEILYKLARGGMAELFLARSTGPYSFEKLVVLKRVAASHAQNPKVVQLFFDEARLVATLDHPHIAQVHDIGMVDGQYFFTMEYVHGKDVRSLLSRTAKLKKPIPIDQAVRIVCDVAAALHYAHERRRPDGTLLDIVHSDVSPSNIVISYDGAVKLVDFGVAKTAISSLETRTNSIRGKISYLSPEHAQGIRVDRRSDVFSLGIVLWELITARQLFRSDSDLATLHAIIHTQPPPPTEFRRDCSPELARITAKALAVDLDARYQTAEQLQIDLEELARESRLSQSRIGVRVYMHQVFAAEIAAWTEAQESGTTLTDHVLATGVETTPADDSDFALATADLEPVGERDVDPPTILDIESGLDAETTIRGRRAAPDAGGVPVVRAPTAPPVNRHLWASGQVPIVISEVDRSGPTQFPLAPKEWLADSAPPKPVVTTRIVVMIFAAIVVLAILASLLVR